jgi:hypothetical protein
MNREMSTNGAGEMFFNFIMSRNGFFSTGTGIDPNRVVAAFAQEEAPMLQKVAEQRPALHVTWISTVSARGSSLKASSRSFSSMS